MEIETGLFTHMVLQRNTRGVCDATITGTAQGSGPVLVRVSGKSKKLKQWDGVKVGKAAGGRFTARVTGLPVGGPYTIELGVGAKESVKVADVLVGDVWIAAGQSNMEGCGEIKWREKKHPMVRAFYMHDAWDVAQEQITNRWICVDQVHADLCGGVRPPQSPVIGNSPAVSFGQKLHRLSGVPIGLIACAHGGTSMAQWSPELKGLEGKSLYGAMVRRVKKNGGKVAGMIWYQGESDTAPETAAVYTQKMKEFIAAARKDCGNSQMLFVGVQIGRFATAGEAKHWNFVQEQERLLPRIVRNCTFVPAIDLPLDDAIHVGQDGPNRLGRRLAQAAYTLARGKGALPGPIDIKSVKIEYYKPRNNYSVIVEFANVVGGLTSGDARPMGFSVTDSSGNPQCFAVTLQGNKAILRTGLQKFDLGNATLRYGAGLDPACNVHDEAGRSLPVFGPVALGVPRALTEFIRTFDVSSFQPSAAKLHGLPCPNGEIAFAPRTFGDRFASMRPEIVKEGEKDQLLYYRTRFDVSEAMGLKIMIGYDGPMKLWFDAQEIAHDPEGTNPALPEQRVVAVQAAAGRHEITVALGTNSGRAWGIFLRMLRTDVSAKQLKAGGYAMPAVVGA